MFKENDIVWHGLSRLVRYTGGPQFEFRHLTVAEAFELAGIEVKGKIVCNARKCWVDDWGEFDDFEIGCDAGHTEEAPDLSRTPVSDCWDVLPKVVREAVEKKLEEGK